MSFYYAERIFEINILRFGANRKAHGKTRMKAENAPAIPQVGKLIFRHGMRGARKNASSDRNVMPAEVGAHHPVRDASQAFDRG